MKDDFYFKYAQENYQLSELEAIKYRKHIENSFGYNVAFLQNELENAARYLLKAFLKGSRIKR